MIVAIIPARGGSKRIPGKNIKPFAGRPMISYSIRAAREAGLFDKIIVTTDSQQIADVAKAHGADIPFIRPGDLADDHTGTDPVVLHALNWLLDHGHPVEYLCCIYATAPLIKPEYLRQGLEILKKEKAATAFSVTTFPYPVFRGLKINPNGRVEMVWPENFQTRSQDWPEVYHDAGQFYWADAVRYLEGRRLFSDDALPIVLPRHLVQDIDTPEDWEKAELIYRALIERA